MMANKKVEIVKHAPTAIVAPDAVPDYLRLQEGQAPEGLENMERGDMTLPRLGLCQSMSPQRKRTDPKFISGLEEGMFFNSVSGALYGADLQVVPLLFFKTRILFGESIGKGIMCQSADAKHGTGDPGGDCFTCPMAQFGTKGERPMCNHFYNYACLVYEKEELRVENLVVLSLKSSGIRTAKDWNYMIRCRRADIFAGIYNITSAEQKNDKGNWFTPVIKPAGWITEQMKNAARMAYLAVSEMNKEQRLRVDIEDLTPTEDVGEVA